MKNSLKTIIIVALVILSSCSPNKSDLESIFASKKYEILILDYHGSLSGHSSQSDEPSKLSVEKTAEGTILNFTDYRMDKPFSKNLSADDVNYIQDWAYSLLDYHDSNKPYDGSCMGSNTDFEFKNDELSVILQPTGDGEFADYDLLHYLGYYEKSVLEDFNF